MKNRDIMRNVIYAFKYIYGCRSLYIFIVILSACLTGAYKIGFVYLINVLTRTVIEQNLSGFLYLSSGFFIIYIGILIINSFAQNFLLPAIENKIALDIQSDVYDAHILNPLSCVRNSSYLDNYYFAINHGKETLMGLVNSVGTLVSSLASLLGVSIIFYQYNFYVVFIAFLGVFVSFLISLKKEKVSYKKMEDDMPANRKIYYSNQIFYQSEFQKEIRTSSTKIFFDILNDAFASKLAVIQRWRCKITLYDFLIKGATVISTFTIIVIIGMQTIYGIYHVSVFAMLFVGINQINNDFGQILSSIPHIYGLTLRIDKFRGHFMHDNSYETVGIDKLESIKFEKVNFSYAENEIFKNMNIEIKCDNKIVHIIGHNGIGKSTFINLLVGIENPCSGKIFYNNINAKNIKKEKIKNIFSIIYQEPQIYHLSIMQNITLKSEYSEADVDRVKKILVKLGLWDKLEKLENGIDTIVNEENTDNNSGFSKGELQKIAIARAIFKESECLIFDEPFNYFDMRSKESLEELLVELSKTKTILIISHIPLSKNIIENSNTSSLNMEVICK